MCGIAGIISPTGRTIDPGAIRQMLSSLVHRGPDDEGVFFDDGKELVWTDARGQTHRIKHPWPASGNCPVVALGHRRLAIIDLTEAGHQPMADEESRYWITFNGEIFNYIELREELSSLGRRFRTQTDTEVILVAYRQWGESCFNRFNGMWALGIWDAKERKLILSRDRFGIKPVYISRPKGAFCFASEPKALLAFSERRPNPEILSFYLVNGMMDFHPTQTFFSDINRIPGGYNLEIHGASEHSIAYWNPAVPDSSLKPNTFEEACADFLELFTDSVKLRLRSDVPVGSCLSGGLDSSAIVCAIAGLKRKSDDRSAKQHVVTARYGETDFDEWSYADIVAKKTGVEMHLADASARDLLESIEKFIECQDEPFIGLSMYAQWCVFREAKKHGLTVMLDGQGADELLGGYEPWGWYFKDLLFKFRWSQVLNESRLYSERCGKNQARLLMSGFFLPNSLSRNIITALVGGELSLARFVSKELAKSGRRFENEYLERSTDLWHLLMMQWAVSSLPALLRFEDRNSMAYSIEARLPYMDYRLMRLVFSLPDDHKLRNGWTKAVLRESVKGLIPEEVRLRKIKQGFPTPQKDWMVSDLKDFSKEVLSSEKTQNRGWFDNPELKKAIDNVDFYRTDICWRMLNSEIWARLFLDKSVSRPIFME